MSDDLDELFDATGDANDFDPHFEASLRHRVEMRDEIIEALTAERDQLYERWNDCQEKRMAAVARAEAAEAREARLRAACAPLGPAMYFMDDRAPDEDVCIISAKTVKDIRAALKGEQK